MMSLHSSWVLFLLVVTCGTKTMTTGFVVVPTRSISLHHQQQQSGRIPIRTLQTTSNGNENNSETNDQPTNKVRASKRDMLSFAGPALGIYLTNPLLSNIDNAFVGQTVGTSGLAALSPATLCTDQMLYLFSFLGRATTSLVARAYGRTTNTSQNGNVEAAREAAATPLTVSLLCGCFLSLMYAVATPAMLKLLQVDPSLHPPASSYIYWRGAVAWAALAQSACLSTLMATRDSLTPLKIIGLAALINVIGDSLFCQWPLRWGCGGAAAATALATLTSCGFMIRALHQKQLLPRIKRPSKTEWQSLLEFTGPMLAITLTRLGGFMAMQRRAMRLGVQNLAGYQLCVNIMMFFLLFGEPLSQLSQTKLPSLLEDDDGPSVRANVKSILTLTSVCSVAVAAVAVLAALFGSRAISSDAAVLQIARGAAPSLFLAVLVSIVAIAVDGAMLASRDFGFMLACGLATFGIQLRLLPKCTTVSAIFHTFTFRLGSYAVAAMVRSGLGFGMVGKVLRGRRTGSSRVSWKEAKLAAGESSPSPIDELPVKPSPSTG